MLCQRTVESRAKNQVTSSSCPCCNKSYDGSTNRCVQDACGHFRCFLCVFQGVKCVHCFSNSHQRSSAPSKSSKASGSNKSQRHQHHHPGPNDETRKQVFNASTSNTSNANNNIWQLQPQRSVDHDLPQVDVSAVIEDPAEPDDDDHHYWLYQPVEEEKADGSSNSSGQSRRENLLLPNVDPATAAQLATSRLMTPIAEEDSQLSSDEELEMPALGIPNATAGQVIDHIYCSISDDDLPSKEFEDSIAESSFPDIIRPSIGIAPRLPPRRPDVNTIASIPSSSNSYSSSNSTQNPVYDPCRGIQGTGSSESLKSLSTDSSSNTVRNSASVLLANAALVAPPKQQKSSLPSLGWPASNNEAQLKMNKSTSLSSVCVSNTTTTTSKQHSSSKPLSSVSCASAAASGGALLGGGGSASTSLKPFGTMPCAQVSSGGGGDACTSATSHKRLSVSAFPPQSGASSVFSQQPPAVGVTEERTVAAAAANFMAETQSSALWRPIRFDMPEFSLDVAISGRTWLVALIEDSLLQPSFEGDTLCKGVLVVGGSGTGKTKLFSHLVLHSAIADDVFVETAELRKGGVSRSRESLEESSRSADSLQLDSNHSSLKSNGSATALAGGVFACSAAGLLLQSGDNLSNHSGGGGTHTPARNTNSFDASLSYESSQKDSPASTVDSGIKTSPANTLNNFPSDGVSVHTVGGVAFQPNYDSGQFSLRGGLTTSHSVSSSSNCYFLSQRVLAAFFCQAADCATNNVGNIVHTLIYHAQNRVAPYKKLLLCDEKLGELTSWDNCCKNPLDAMKNGLFDPMSQLLADGQIVGDYFIILIDAIEDKEQSLCIFLSSLLHILPSWIKLLCSCRKDSFSKLSHFVQTLEVFNLEDNFFSKDVEISKDLDLYISYLVTNSSSNLKEIIFNSRDVFNKLRSVLLSNCQRSFLYIRSCFDLINSGAINLKSLTKNSVPQTLYAIFDLLCNQICHSSLAIFHKIRVIIDVIITSFYPMTVEEIWNVVRLSKYSKEEFDKNFELVHGQFLVMRNNRTFEFSSNCLRSWFIDIKLSKKFSCDLRLGHALHAIALAYSTVGGNGSGGMVHPGVMIDSCYSSRRPGSSCAELDMVWHLVQCELWGAESSHPMYEHNLLWINWLLPQTQLFHILGNMHFLMAPNLKVAEMLVKCGADVNAVSDYEGLPVLSVCAFLGHCDLLTLLLAHGANINKQDGTLGRTALSCACIRGHRDVCEVLLKSGCCCTLTPDVHGLTAVEHAASGGYLDVLKLLIHSSTPAAIERSLVLAAYNGYKHVVQFLLKGGYISNEALDSPFEIHFTQTAETALTAAASRGHNETCEVLSDHGASLTAKNGQQLTPLLAAVSTNQEDIIFDLWKLKKDQIKSDPQSVDPEIERDAMGRTALIIAAANGNQVIVEYLLQYGSTVSEADYENLTALCWACRNGHVAIAEMLLEEEANVNHRDSKGRCPLDLAASFGDEALLQLLLHYGGELDKTCDNGLRPLDHAVQANNIGCVALLMRKGARIGQASWKAATANAHIMLLFLNKLTEDGSIFYRQKKYPDAMKRFALALKKFPRQKHEFGNYTSSFRDLKVTLYLNISRCNRKINKLDNAIHYANRALALKPGCYEGYYARARAKRASRDFKGAMDDLREASKLAPDNSEIVCLLQRVKLESAIQSGEIQAFNPIASKTGVNQIKNYSLDEDPVLAHVASITSDLASAAASSALTSSTSTLTSAGVTQCQGQMLAAQTSSSSSVVNNSSSGAGSEITYQQMSNLPSAPHPTFNVKDTPL